MFLTYPITATSFPDFTPCSSSYQSIYYSWENSLGLLEALSCLAGSRRMALYLWHTRKGICFSLLSTGPYFLAVMLSRNRNEDRFCILVLTFLLVLTSRNMSQDIFPLPLWNVSIDSYSDFSDCSNAKKYEPRYLPSASLERVN